MLLANFSKLSKKLNLNPGVSGQGLHCLPQIQKPFRHINRQQNDLQTLGQVW